MSALNPDILLINLDRLCDDIARHDTDWLFKLLVLNNTPGVIHSFRTRTLEHDGCLQQINPKLSGRDVFFAGGLSIVKNKVAELDGGGTSLEGTGYDPISIDNKLAVHALLGEMFYQIADSGFSLCELPIARSFLQGS